MLELSRTGNNEGEHYRESDEDSEIFQYTRGEPHLRHPVSPGPSDDDRPEVDDSRSQITDVTPQMMSLEDDVDWSILSNAFFVAGGFIYVIGTTWDYAMFSSSTDPDNLDLHSILHVHEYFIYQAVWIMGPLVYFMNSVIDVKWALIVKERNSRRRHLEKLLIETPDTPSKRNRRGRIKAALQLMRPKIFLNRIRRHIGHRRQLGAATTFGMAALLGIIAAVCSLLASDTSLGQGETNSVSDWASTLESASVHMYLISAIFALWRSPSEFFSSKVSESTAPWYSNVEILETFGDATFGMAALIDVVLQDNTIDDGIFWLPVISAVLWTVDALLYLRGDFASLYKDVHAIDFGEGNL